MFEVIPLGTGSALPSRDRHFSATVVQLETSLYLFDCGEGTQHRFLDAGLRLTRIEAIFITHLHGDHYLGLPGLLSTLTLLNHEKPLTVIGPRGVRAFIDSIPSRNKAHETSLDLHIQEIDPENASAQVYDSSACTITTEPLVHSVQTAGYRFKEKDRPGNLDVHRARMLGIHDFMDYRALKEGRSIRTPDGKDIAPETLVGPTHPGASFAYITDTMPCPGGRLLADEADLVYHEATFIEADRQRAEQTKHATAREAATIASEAGAHQLLIGHFSGRYKETAPLLEEARAVFKNTHVAEELKPYTIAADVAPTENLTQPS